MINKCRLASYPIRELNEEKMPINMASACIIEYLNKHILLTVYHATGNNGNWAIELEYVPSENATKMQQLGGLHFIKQLNITNGEEKDIDFAFIEVDKSIDAFHQEIDYQSNKVNNQYKRLIVSPVFVEPSMEDEYCFSGWIKGQKKDQYLYSENVQYNNLKYIGKKDEYLLFKLPFSHPGHDFFQGCSGAPIMNKNGDVVALVCYGDIKSDTIYGISLQKFRMAIDAIYNGNI